MGLRSWVALSAVVGALLLLPMPGFPQATTARFYGVVQDSSGAIVPGASVTLTNEGTGSIAEKTADASGEFGFDFVRVGEYTLKIQADGFKTYQSRGIQLAASQNVRQIFALELGTLSETIDVEGVAPLVDTITAEQRQSFDTLTVTELPLARRNFSNILSIGTGVSSSESGGHRGLRMNGVGKSGANYAVDATDASGTNEGRLSAMHQGFNYIDILSIEAVQEVQTIKGVISAEYGQSLSGTINLITKSGTNQFHGSLFENFQSENLAARQPFLAKRVPLTFNQFGGSIGGPIIRDRIFFFTTYEGYRESAFREVSGNVPTPALRQDMLAAVPEYRVSLETMPLPTDPHAATADVGFFRGARRLISRENHVVAKSDFRITDASNLALTYTRGRPYQTQPSYHIGNERVHLGWVERGTANFITGGAEWSSETRFGYNLTNVNRVHQFYLTGLDESQPEASLGGRRTAAILGPGFSTAESEILDLGGPVWTIEEKFARHVGQHSLKFGAKYSSRGGGRANIEIPRAQYNTRAALLANEPDRLHINFGVNPYTYDAYELGFFAQDDWRISPRLVVNLGLRYDYFSNYVAKPSTDLPAGLFNPDGFLDDRFNVGPLRDPNRPIEPDGMNIGPRIGFSYNPDGSGKTVIRGGLSVMFTPLMWTAFNIAVSSEPNVPRQIFLTKAEAAAFGLRYPIYNDNVRPLVEASNQVQLSDLFQPDIEAPYTMNLYLGVQRSITPTTMIESAFVGNRGVKMTQVRRYNPVDRLSGQRPNPALGEGRYYDSSGNTVYYSWQTSVRKQYSHSFSGSFHYTWGKALAYTGGDISATTYGDQIESIQDFFNWRADRGPSSGDVTHYVAAETIYELPRFNGMSSAVARQILGGWQASGILRAGTGPPLRLAQQSSIVGSRPDYIGGEAVLDDYRSTLQYLNPAAFTRVPIIAASGATVRPGNVGNGAVRGPGSWGVDFSLGKAFAIRESTSLQIRADMFNALNHVNFVGVESRAERSTFGRLISSGTARVIQLNARLSW